MASDKKAKVLESQLAEMVEKHKDIEAKLKENTMTLKNQESIIAKLQIVNRPQQVTPPIQVTSSIRDAADKATISRLEREIDALNTQLSQALAQTPAKFEHKSVDNGAGKGTEHIPHQGIQISNTLIPVLECCAQQFSRICRASRSRFQKTTSMVYSKTTTYVCYTL